MSRDTSRTGEFKPITGDPIYRCATAVTVWKVMWLKMYLNEGVKLLLVSNGRKLNQSQPEDVFSFLTYALCIIFNFTATQGACTSAPKEPGNVCDKKPMSKN
ncbi:hypothetical protein Bpfe_028617 [Biomphalaria pfeifferi]|uniref:Uncharacterized protein n=1 Tax=Biomphalaria pfeifferi TaxID=112525 RepID=A0AAD8EVK2_BIOPF|nr:hypothetical protein Bpfe_028617 [Biomphalaria pfeifferi]